MTEKAAIEKRSVEWVFLSNVCVVCLSGGFAVVIYMLWI